MVAPPPPPAVQSVVDAPSEAGRAGARAVETARVTPLLIGIAAGAISFAGSWIPSVWSDEAATISASERSWSQIGALVAHVDLVHATYYALMHIWLSVVGVSPLTLRLPSAVAIGFACAGLVVLGRRIATPRIGLYSGVVLAILPRTTWAGIEGRSPALAMAAGVWLTVLFVSAVRRDKSLVWAAYALTAWAATLLWLFLFFLVIAHGATLAFASVARGRHDRRAPLRVLGRWMLAAAAAAALLAPFLVRVPHQSGAVSWIPGIGVDTVRWMAIDQWFGSHGALGVPAAFLCWTAAVIGVVRLVRRPRTHDALMLPLAVASIVVPAVGVVVLSVLTSPVYVPKYLAFCVPAMALLIGTAVAALSRRWMRVVAVLVIVASVLPAYVLDRTPTAKDGSDWGAVVRALESRKHVGDAVIFENLRRAPASAIRVAYPRAFDSLRDPGTPKTAAVGGTLWDTRFDDARTVARITDSTARVWVVSRHGAAEPQPLGDAGFHRTWQRNGTQTDLTLYER